MCTKYSKREKVWLHCLGWLVCLIKEKYTSLQCIVLLLERGGGGGGERELGPFYINVSLKKAYIAIAILWY